jgi:hypothetical protein
VNGADRQQHGWHVEGAAPAEPIRRPARDDKRQRAAKLVTGADDSDGPAALQRRKPVRSHAHGWRPAQRLHAAVARPDKGEEVKGGGPAEQDVERGRRQQAAREQFARREVLGELAINELPHSVRQLQRHEHRAELRFRVVQFRAESRQRDAEVVSAEIE